jgi:2-polyprenyl-3-methyl-5-hydroxy-6-metoxy-1,4-benzoquinol methylase
MDPITEALRRHYSEKFSLHGPTSEGVDWGPDESKMLLRYEKMLTVIETSYAGKSSLLDVGCGYGGLFNYLAKRGIPLDYTGIDVAENMIKWAKDKVGSGKFMCGDVLSYDFTDNYDYVVCSGILTQKLEVSVADMDRYAANLIRKMFALCKRGAAFNVMTTKVNYFSNNLYYRNPAELLSWCISEITPHIKMDHAYPLYEYTVYLYREPVSSPDLRAPG